MSTVFFMTTSRYPGSTVSALPTLAILTLSWSVLISGGSIMTGARSSANTKGRDGAPDSQSFENAATEVSDTSGLDHRRSKDNHGTGSTCTTYSPAYGTTSASITL